MYGSRVIKVFNIFIRFDREVENKWISLILKAWTAKVALLLRLLTF